MNNKYQDRNIDTEERIKDLLSKMTLKEKIVQMSGVSNKKILDSALEGNVPEEGFGAVFARYFTREELETIYRNATEGSRLKIPPIIFDESLHGIYRPDGTSFPQSIGMGSTFNEELVYRCAEVIGQEARNEGIRQVLAPNIDISRDPRWGRVEENYGEDTYLTSRMGINYVKGIQSNGVAATVKHYAVHGSPEGGLNIAPVHAGEREWRESIIEPFAKAISDGGALSVMPAYSELDGIPLHTNRKMLTDVLRDEFGFYGYTISDFGALPMLVSLQHTAKDLLDAGVQALHAGLDMEATSKDCYGPEMLKAAECGNICIEEIDLAVSRILRVKFLLGLFDEDSYTIPVEMHSEKSQLLALEAGEESIVMLKNNGILPLDPDGNKKILLVGVNADSAQLGDYSFSTWDKKTVTLRKALEERIGKNLIYHLGCGVASTDPSLEDAKKDAKNADIIIVVLGDNSMMHRGIGWSDINTSNACTCGEGHDVSSLILPEPQRNLLREMKSSGKPIILVLENGRPYCIGEECEISDAVLEAWYPGERGGEAVSNIIFGDVSPSGKLPISFPRSAGHLPCFYNHKVSARGFYHVHGSPDNPGSDYVFDSPDALFPFGYGLSYASFEYSSLAAEANGPDDINVSVKVKNTGNMKAKEAVLMFISQKLCPVTPFIKRLRAFTKVELNPGDETEVVFRLGREDVSYIDFDMKSAVGSGQFEIEVGGLKTSFEL